MIPVSVVIIIINSNEEHPTSNLVPPPSAAHLRVVLPDLPIPGPVRTDALQVLQLALHLPNVCPGDCPSNSVLHHQHVQSLDRQNQQQGQTENSDSMIVFIVVGLLCLISSVYWIFLQYYVLMVEVILSALTALFILLETILGFALFWQFKNYQKQT